MRVHKLCVSFLFLFACLLSKGAWGQQNLFLLDEDEEDLLVEVFAGKRVIPLLEKKGLHISGDVRFTYRRVSELIRSVEEEGSVVTEGAELLNPFGFYNDIWKSDVNLLVDYQKGCSWASIALRFSNVLGFTEGTYNKISLERGLLGYMLYQQKQARWYVELGRQPLFDKFDSDVQFASRLDGIYSVVEFPFPRLGNCYGKGAFLIVNAAARDYAFVCAIGVTDFRGTGWYAHYSLTDWGATLLFDQIENLDSVLKTAHLYVISQWELGYIAKDFWCGKGLKIYGAYLVNHKTNRLRVLEDANLILGDNVPDPRTQRNGAYVGLQLGRVRKKGDWAAKLQFQYVELLAILPMDNQGIGRGNEQGNVVFDVISETAGNYYILNFQNSRGNVNYWGPSVEVAYGITSDLNVRFQVQHSNSVRADFGGFSNFTKVDLRFVYAF